MTSKTTEESPFHLNELFVSSTDKSGIILAGNEVFYRVSEYSRDELLKQPHNRIRHPDMPKAAFRMFWDSIGSNEPFCAYVKNRSKSGKYYWVLATVIPISSGYISIRLKPTTELLEVVEGLYQKVQLTERESGGVPAGIELTLTTLKSLGFGSYKMFMVHALFKELESRQKLLSAETPVDEDFKATGVEDSFYSNFGLMKEVCDRNLNEFIGGVDAFAAIEGFYRDFLKQSQVILDACRCLETLSLNMAVSANKLGKKGIALNLVSGAFQRSAKEVISRFTEFGSESQNVTDAVLSTGLKFGILRLIVEVMSKVTGEVIHHPNFTKEEKARLVQEQKEFTLMAAETLETVKAESNLALQSVVKFKRYLITLKSMMVGFDMIRLGGRLEGSRNEDTDLCFSPFIDEMMKFLDKVDRPIQEMTHQIESVHAVINSLQERLFFFTGSMVQIEICQIRAETSSLEAA